MRSPGWVLLTALVILVCLGATASPQAPSADTPKPAANAWMLTPTPYLEWNKGISPEIRAARDRYADVLQGASARKYPLTSPKSDALGPGIGDGIPRSDLRPVQNRVILMGTFTSYRSVLSASEFSLYSELTVSVSKVFEDGSNSGALPYGQITILLTGGTVLLKDGRVLTYDTQPRSFSLQPDHNYLLELSYHSEGNFYLVDDDWDITDGTLRPNTRPAEYRAQHGLSALSGLTVEQLGPALDKLLHPDQ